MKKSYLLLVFLSVQFILTLSLGTTVAYGIGKGKVPAGLTCLGIDLSYRSEEQALGIVQSEIPGAVSFNDQVFPLETSESYASLAHWLRKQLTSDRGSRLKVALDYLGQQTSLVPEPEEYLLRSEVIPQLERIKGIIDRPAIPPSVTFSDGRLVHFEGQDGLALDIELSWQSLLKNHGMNPVPLIVKTISSSPGAKELESVQSILGDYTTYFDPLDKARTNNVRLAASALNGILILPGGTFSFNETVGERTKSGGYLPASIFQGFNVVPGDGGGVCQDSTTLYQAVQQAHLEVIERHSHTLGVSYVPKGQDATVSYGVLDFQFKNDTYGYLLISVSMGENWLRIRLFGNPDERHPPLKRPDGYPIQPTGWDNYSK